METTFLALMLAALLSTPLQLTPEEAANPHTIMLLDQLATLEVQLEDIENGEGSAAERRAYRDSIREETAPVVESHRERTITAHRASNSMPELAIWKLEYESEGKTIYLRTNEEVSVSSISLEGYELDSTFDKAMSENSCIGAGKNKKCGGFVRRLSVSPELPVGEYTLQVGSESQSFSVR